MFGLVPTLPTFSEITTETTSYTAGMFTDVLSLVALGLGLAIGGLVLAWISGKVYRGVKVAIRRR